MDLSFTITKTYTQMCHFGLIKLEAMILISVLNQDGNLYGDKAGST